MVAVEILVFVVGFVVVTGVLFGAIRTVVVPRAEAVWLNRVLFGAARRVFGVIAKRSRDPERREAWLARMAPTALMSLPIVWALGVILGFSAMFWALGERPFRAAFVLSGSSLTTLGFRTSDDLDILVPAIFEALIGLGLIALLISFLPTMYAAFSRRETAVSKLSARAGSPPTPREMLVRAHRIGWLTELDEVWMEWDVWFTEVEESHTSYPALVFFRSPRPERSWLLAAESALDTAAMLLSAVDVPRSPRAMLCIRSGYQSLRHIADFFRIKYDADPSPTDPISVPRAAFDDLYDTLAAEGLPMVADRDQAWRDFAGWRVNYDTVLVALGELVVLPEARRWPVDASAG